MRKIIPFRKDLDFKDNIHEITSISLEHEIKSKTDSLISGSFTISGDYKELETSITRKEFNYNIPFDIALGNKIDLETMILDIDDFHYEICSRSLKVNIDLILEAEELSSLEDLREVTPSQKEVLEVVEEPKIESNINIDAPKERSIIPTLNDETVIEKKAIVGEVTSEINIPFETKETYSAYRIYVVKEGDTVSEIIKKYNVSEEDLKDYNDLEDIKQGDKIIIPYVRM